MDRNKKIKIILSAIFASFLFFTEAQAGFLDAVIGTPTALIGKLISIISYGILMFIGQFIIGVAYLTDKVLKLNNYIAVSPTVQTGWTICRDIANLGFVLVLIIIALATVLRYKNYRSQELLIKLIGAAIIVNFSLTIAGFVLNFTNVLTGFFLNRAFGGGEGLATGIANAFQPQKYLNFNLNFSAGGGIAFLLNSAINATTGAIFSFIILIILLCFLILFIIRYVALTILLVVAPIAWLLWVIPATSSYFSQWWKKFLNWAFFAPTCIFFLYLAMIGISQVAPSANPPANPGAGAAVGSLEPQGSLTAQLPAGSDSTGSSQAWYDVWGSQTTTNTGNLFADIGTNILNLLVFGFLMIGGLMMASKFSLIGAKAVVNAGTAASKAGGKWLGKKGLKYPALGTGKALSQVSDKLGNQGWRGAINRFTGLKYGVAGSRAVKTSAIKLGEKIKTGPKTEFSKAVFGKDSLLGSVWASSKKGSGLFKEAEKKKKKKEIEDEKKERDRKKKGGQTSIKEGQGIIDKLSLIEKALELKTKAAEAEKNGDAETAQKARQRAAQIEEEYDDFLKQNPGKSLKELKEQGEEKIKAGEELITESEKHDERIKDITNDLAQEKRGEDVEKEAHKKAEEHATEHSGGGEHKEESHPSPASGGGDKGGHGGH